MAPQSKSHSGNRHRAQRPNRLTLARKIARDAQLMVDEPEAEVYDRLLDNITRCLANGNQVPLDEALNDILEAPDAVEELEETIQEAATACGGLFNLETNQYLETRLVAIPLMLAVSGAQHPEVPMALKDDDLDWLAKSFREHGLKHPTEESVMVLPELWLAEQIYNWSYPAVYRLTQACRQGLADGVMPDVCAVLKDAPFHSPLEQKELSFCLRYLLVAFLHPFEEDLAFDLEANLEKVDQWQEAVAKRLGQAFQGPIEIFDPDALYDALESGWQAYHLLGKGLERKMLLEEAGLLPAEVAAVLSVHGEDGYVTQLRTAYYGPGKEKPAFLGGTVWAFAPFDDPGEVVEMVIDCLQEEGIGKIEVIDGVQEELSCPDCGEPIYAMPSGKGAATLMQPPHPGHLH